MVTLQIAVMNPPSTGIVAAAVGQAAARLFTETPQTPLIAPVPVAALMQLDCAFVEAVAIEVDNVMNKTITRIVVFFLVIELPPNEFQIQHTAFSPDRIRK